MNNNGSLATSGTTMLTGMNTVGLMALLAYTVRNVSEMNMYLDEIRDELKSLKSSHVDNTKRTHMAIAKISEKLNMAEQKKKRIVPEPKVVELDDDLTQQVDEVSAAIDELMK